MCKLLPSVWIFSHGLIDGFERKGMEGSKKYIHKNNTLYTEYIKGCTKAVTFCFFDDFRSKNGLPASYSNRLVAILLVLRLNVV
jgi:hypothetical protein